MRNIALITLVAWAPLSCSSSLPIVYQDTYGHGAHTLRVATGSPGELGLLRPLLKKLEPATLEGKVAGAFSVNSAYGGQKTVDAIEKHLQAAGARTPQQGVVIRAGVPFSLFRGTMASRKNRDQLRVFGFALASAAKDDDQEAQ